MQTIRTKDAPQPAGHYSQAVVRDDVVYVSGQLPMCPQSGKVADSVAEQAEQALKNVSAILRAADSSLEDVVQMTIYISDIDQWATVNEVYARMMGDHRPARAIVPVPTLHHNCCIEIQAIASCRD